MASHAALAKLGRYEVVKHLARGGMADVLLARTTGTSGFARHLVLKRIHAEQAFDSLYVSMFLDEARLAASLHHHNIVQVTDIGEADGEYFFTMEYVHGEDVRVLLSRVSKRGELVPLAHVLSIVCAAAAGLHHAHEQRGPDRRLLGIVHRDVSPANILVGYDGAVKVADFGIAKASHRTNETASGTLKGKVAYMSPEQAVGEAVDRRSDVFSLGIVMYELLTARRLFKGENDFLTMTSIVLGYIPPASELRADLPAGIETILMKALANKPDDRYATTDELRLALEQVAAQLQLPMSSTGLADYMKYIFGERPLPWLVDDAPVADEGIDFDGSRLGVARPPTEDLQQVETRALDLRSSVRASRESDVHDMPVLMGDIPELPGELVPFDDESSPSSVILLVPKHAVEPPPPQRVPRRETEIPPLHIGRTLMALVALISIAVAIYIARTGVGELDMQAVVPPVEDRPLPIKPLPSAPDAPPLPTGAVIDTDPQPPAPVVVPEPKKSKIKKPAATRAKPLPPKQAPARKRWDPNALFPE